MHKPIPRAACWPALAVLAGLLCASSARGGALLPQVQGSAVVMPGRATVNQWTTQRVVYTAGPEGIAEGGGLKIQFPKSWEPDGYPGLSLDPTQPYYVTAFASRPGVHIRLSITHEGIEGRTDWKDWTARLTVTGGSLLCGDIIIYTFGDRGGGGPGARAAPKADTELVGLAVDGEGDGSFSLLGKLLTVESVAGPAHSLSVVAPSLVAAREAFLLTVVARDALANAVEGYAGSVTFSSTDPDALLPPPYTFTAEDKGIHIFSATLNTPGAQWITATDAVLAPEGASSNPVSCQPGEVALGLYWGDLHSHTDFSVDATGRPAGAYEFARDVARLSFYATSDHLMPTECDDYTPEEWAANRALVQQYYVPGQFVTLLGYEWTKGAPYGNHNVYFRGPDGTLCSAWDFPTTDALWACLEGQAALTIPHHTGKRFPDGNSRAVDMTRVNDTFRRSIEIYSMHGESEVYNPGDPLSYESVGAPGTSSVAGPHYARDGWAFGQPLGVIASSDNHDGRPGQAFAGLAAVYAPQLTREAVFDAIAAGHTYGTTGQRIVLDLRVDGHMMGETYTVTLPSAPSVEVRVIGTDDLDYVQVVKYDGITYTVPYSVTALESREAAFTWTDADLRGDALYYVRLAQVRPVRDRLVMAWSSPVWVRTLVPIQGLEATNDSPTRLGHATTVMATITAGSDVTYTWALGDGAIGKGASVRHVYATAGEYTAVVTATNSVSLAVDSTRVVIYVPCCHLYLPLVLRQAP
jgi:hypothetical protein